MGTARVTELEADLNHFDPAIRARALRVLVSLVEQTEPPVEAETGVVNMHCHTFFSFNAFGYSPSFLAWLGRRRGYALMGIVDFDVLDGVEEFLAACELVGLRGSAGIETRVFIPEHASDEINSPGEPGVAYHMGIGFTSGHVPESVTSILADLRDRAAQRNRAIVTRINAHLAPVTVNYEHDVLPLTPAGNPTERHIVVAYVKAVERAVAAPAAFWAERLNTSSGQVEPLMPDSPALQNLIRARLMKQGGVGYVQPESGMFPTLEAYHTLIAACGALPCAAWLDGTLAAEEDPERWLSFLVSKGAVALNLIPDRNWNISDPGLRRLKVDNLYRVVEVAQQLDLPLNVGTEMNSFGQKVADDFDAPELAPLRQAFAEGARFIHGHTVMQRALELGYASPWAQAHLPTRRERNEFYTRVGHLAPAGQKGMAQVRLLDAGMAPADVLCKLAKLSQKV